MARRNNLNKVIQEWYQEDFNDKINKITRGGENE